MLTFEKTLSKIQIENLPFWELQYYGQGYENKVQIARNDNPDMELSVKALEFNVYNFTNPEQMRFCIKASPTKTSNKGTIFTWDFSVNGNMPSQFPQQQNNQQSQFGGFNGFVIPGQIDDIREEKSELRRKAEKLEDQKDELRKEDTRLQIERIKLDHDFKNFKELEKNTIAELKVLEQKYNSNTEAAKNGASMLLAETLKLFNANAKGKGLSGLFAPVSTDEPNAPMSAEDQEIEKIALAIQNAKLPAGDIIKLGTIINDLIVQIKTKKSGVSGSPETSENKVTQEKNNKDGISEQENTNKENND
jgi:hypothetical protein